MSFIDATILVYFLRVERRRHLVGVMLNKSIVEQQFTDFIDREYGAFVVFAIRASDPGIIEENKLTFPGFRELLPRRVNGAFQIHGPGQVLLTWLREQERIDPGV